MAAGKLPLHERALRLLAVRPRTRRELQTRLVRAGFDPHEVEAELDRLEEGRRAVAAGLAAKGIDRRLIDQALQGASGDDGDRLARLAQARAGRLGTLPPEAAYRRLVSFLVRRGHEPSAARAAAARALRLGADASESA